MSKLKKYLKESDMVYHTTIDPKGPGVVRIHLIPPKKVKRGVPWVVIVNGYRVLPILTSWAVNLKELIIRINEADELDVEDKVSINSIIEDAAEYVSKNVFKGASKQTIMSDMMQILGFLIDVAKGKDVSKNIGYFTMGEYAKYMSAPHRMDLMISTMEKNGCYNCNQKCIHCYAFGEKQSNVGELSTEEWFKIIDKLKEIRVPQITFTGGEPTMRSDLVELVDRARWFTTRLNTNGILLTKELCEELYKADLDSCQITFYSSNKEIHNKLVGGEHFDETVQGIKNAIEQGLDVSVNTPLCSLNSNYKETIEFLHGLGVKYFTCSGLIPTGNTKSDESKIIALDKEKMLNILLDAYEYTSTNECELQFTSPGWIDDETLKSHNLDVPSCGACLSNMAILPNGEVAPCQSWLNEDSLGNFLNDKWNDIWNGKRCKEIRFNAIENNDYCQLRGNK